MALTAAGQLAMLLSLDETDGPVALEHTVISTYSHLMPGGPRRTS